MPLPCEPGCFVVYNACLWSVVVLLDLREDTPDKKVSGMCMRFVGLSARETLEPMQIESPSRKSFSNWYLDNPALTHFVRGGAYEETGPT